MKMLELHLLINMAVMWFSNVSTAWRHFCGKSFGKLRQNISFTARTLLHLLPVMLELIVEVVERHKKHLNDRIFTAAVASVLGRHCLITRYLRRSGTF